eukprot:TRINITY_DN44378_c0_g1_i1.p1 TRINITY_DN44378_c0_g1~~TRINITY_DN44378_c0_g1_i1.p1  ORF type:complete len:166 (+),score=28.59 TRINITY_DN44378_c0_g1_i1:181-678(+)
MLEVPCVARFIVARTTLTNALLVAARGKDADAIMNVFLHMMNCVGSLRLPRECQHKATMYWVAWFRCEMVRQRLVATPANELVDSHGNVLCRKFSCEFVFTGALATKAIHLQTQTEVAIGQAITPISPAFELRDNFSDVLPRVGNGGEAEHVVAMTFSEGLGPRS